jgi:hypothetical protein
MHFDELLYTNICHAEITPIDLDDFCRAIEKVITHITPLKEPA